jgi:hypothetical protein
MELSEMMQRWRAERPDEWRMDEFIRQAKSMEESIRAFEIHIDNLRREFPIRNLVACEGFLSYPLVKYNAVVDILNSGLDKTK